MFLEECSFLLGLWICWPIIVHSIPLWLFVVLWYQFLCLLFHFLFICILSLFFLVSLARGLSVLFILSENQLLVLLIFLFFLISVLFISSLIFIISFLLLTLGLFVLFLILLIRNVRYVRLFIWDFSCFLRKACISMNFPLITAFAVSNRFCMVVFSSSFASRYFFIFYLFLN